MSKKKKKVSPLLIVGDQSGERSITVAVTLNQRGYNDKTHQNYYLLGFGFAVKNPEDKEELSQLANEIAIGRARKSPKMIMAFEATKIDETFVQELAAGFLRSVKENVVNYVPFGKTTGAKIQSGKAKVSPG